MATASPSEESRTRRLLRVVDGALFVFAGVAAVWLAWLLFEVSIEPGWQSLLLVVFWLLVAYLVLPRLHRILSRIYVPDYFIGRARTADGLLGDPVNLAALGDAHQLDAAMAAGEWTRADDLSLRSGLGIVRSTLTRRSYPEAPVSSLFLFGRQQDAAYQQEVAGSPAQRHHVRFWRCPEGWLLPGGFAVDWVGAATFDRSVGLSLFTGQVTHKIAADTDTERDHLVSTVMAADPAVELEVLRDFSTGYHARNGGGDRIQTDGDLPVLDLRAVAVSPDAVALADKAAEASAAKRQAPPVQLVFGAGVALVRATVLTVYAVALLAGVPGSSLPIDSWSGADPAAGAVALLGAAAVDYGLGIATLARRGWARLLMELSAVSAILASFAILPTQGPGLLLNLPTIATSVLVLLALSSHAARSWSHERRRSLPRLRRVRGGSPPAEVGAAGQPS